jgi:hypothetical protein
VVVLLATLTGLGNPVTTLAHRGLPGPAAEPTGPLLDCNLGFVPVKPTIGVGSIIGNAWAQCTIPPEAHALTLSLERLPRGAGWIAAATNPPDPRIPTPRLVYEIKTACVPGAWRVTATARWHVTSAARRPSGPRCRPRA